MIWTWIKKGESKPGVLFKTKRSLLVSYDMIPLRGLENAERDLNENGRIVKGELVIDNKNPHFYVPFKVNAPHLHSIDWGCCKNNYESAFATLCFCIREDGKTSNDEYKILSDFYYRSLSDDGRKRRPLPRIRQKAIDIIKKRGFEIKPVRFIEKKKEED